MAKARTSARDRALADCRRAMARHGIRLDELLPDLPSTPFELDPLPRQRPATSVAAPTPQPTPEPMRKPLKPQASDVEVVIPENVKFSRGPSHPIDARYQLDPKTPIAGGFLDDWKKRRGGA